LELLIIAQLLTASLLISNSGNVSSSQYIGFHSFELSSTSTMSQHTAAPVMGVNVSSSSGATEATIPTREDASIESTKLTKVKAVSIFVAGCSSPLHTVG
jgi:hypothetical protein